MFSELGKVAVTKRDARGRWQSDAHCRRRLRGAQAAGDEILRRARAVDLVIGPAKLPPPPRPPRRAAAGRRNGFSGRIEVRSPRRARRENGARARSERLRHDPGGLRPVLLVLRRPLHAWGRIFAAGRRPSSRRSRGSSASGVREVCLLGQNVNAYHGLDAAGRAASLADLCHRLAATLSEPCAHPLHDEPPKRHDRRSDRRAPRPATADAVPASAGAIGIGP